MTSEELEFALSIVSIAIRETIDQFTRQPFNAAYESDIRSYLYARIFDAFKESPVDLSNRLKPWCLKRSKDWFVNPVRTEYPAATRFDLSVIDPASHLSDMTPWNQPVHVAIEIKYWQFDGTGGSFKKDLRKLAEYQREVRRDLPFCGIALLFVQPGYSWKKNAPGYAKKLEQCQCLNPGIWFHVVELECERSGWESVRYTEDLDAEDIQELYPTSSED